MAVRDPLPKKSPSAPMFGVSGKSQFLVNIASQLGYRLYLYLTIAGPLIYGIGSAFISGFSIEPETPIHIKVFKYIFFSPWTLIILGVALTFWGAVGSFKDTQNLKERIRKLRKKNRIIPSLEEKINTTQESEAALRNELVSLYQSKVKNWLENLANLIGMGHSERLTIYFENAGSLHVLARYSKNPTIAKIHRISFSIGDGAISKAWEKGEYVDVNCPEFSSLKNEQNEPYYLHNEELYNYSRATLDSLKMKSCRYMGLSIMDVGSPIGVLMFESIDKDGLPEGRQEKIRTHISEQQTHISQHIRDALKYDIVSKHTEDFQSKENVEADFLKGLQL